MKSWGLLPIMAARKLNVADNSEVVNCLRVLEFLL